MRLAWGSLREVSLYSLSSSLMVTVAVVAAPRTTPEESDGRVSCPTKVSSSSTLWSSLIGTITIWEFSKGAKVTNCDIVV